MKYLLILFTVTFFATHTNAQFTKASLQASGLTCSMCSKAVKNALEKVSFVSKVDVDIKSQQYNLSFKQEEAVDFDALAKAVEDAGFAVASLIVTADVPSMVVQKDKHIKIGSSYFHFLNARDQSLQGTASFTIVDKAFVPAKEFKKWSTSTKMSCVQTGKAASCCTASNVPAGSRIYHSII